MGTQLTETEISKLRELLFKRIIRIEDERRKIHQSIHSLKDVIIGTDFMQNKTARLKVIEAEDVELKNLIGKLLDILCENH